MKKKSFVAVIALLLVSMMMLSSCNTVGNISFKKMFDGTQRTADSEAYAKAELATGITSNIYEDQKNQLVLFSDTVQVDSVPCKKYTLYNIESNKVVYEVTASVTSRYDITLYALEEDACFTVAHATWRLDASNAMIGNESVTTALYSADGVKLADATRSLTPSVQHDLIRFDGKCYRMTEGAVLAYAFDYSDLNSMPTILYANDDYYFCKSGDDVAVYDKTLKPISAISLPSYAEIVSGWVDLGKNKVLLQYEIEESDDAEEYDYIKTKTVEIKKDDSNKYTTQEQKKYTLHTVIFNGKNGNIKEIDMEYVVNNTLTKSGNSWTQTYGLSDKLDNIVWLAPIEDKRINEADTAMLIGTIDTDGKFKQLKDLTEMPMESSLPYMVAADRWIASSVDGKNFIVDENGEVVGETTNAYYCENFLYASGKMYDYDLNVIYDYAAENLTLERSLKQAMLFRNADNELICYSDGQSNKLIENGAKRALVHTKREYFVIKDYSSTDAIKYEIYNERGAKLTSISVATGLSSRDYDDIFTSVASYYGAFLLRVATNVNDAGDYKYDYYKISY